MKQPMTVNEFAEMLGVSRDTVERMIKQRKIKAVKKNPLGGRTSPLVIPAVEVERVKKLRNDQAKRQA
jgi:excisionase family DNA binding protein